MLVRSESLSSKRGRLMFLLGPVKSVGGWMNICLFSPRSTSCVHHFALSLWSSGLVPNIFFYRKSNHLTSSSSPKILFMHALNLRKSLVFRSLASSFLVPPDFPQLKHNFFSHSIPLLVRNSGFWIDFFLSFVCLKHSFLINSLLSVRLKARNTRCEISLMRLMLELEGHNQREW